MTILFPTDIFRKFIIGISLLVVALIPPLLYFEMHTFIAFIFAVPILIYILYTFEDNFRFYFIFSIFFGIHIHANSRFQFVNLISYILIFFFFLNHSSKEFNSFRLPRTFKLIVISLISAVFLSSIKTPFLSFWSVYYGFMFFTYIFTGYVIFKSVTNLDIVRNYLNYFYKSVAFFSSIIIIQILFTGNIRSYGLSGPTIPDIINIALIIVIFRSYISGKISMKDIILTTIIFITLITTLSRFAWFGFLLAFIYGIVIVALMYSKKIVTKKSVYLLIGSGVVVAIILTTGIYDIIIKRMMDVQATVLDTTREEGMVSNTLDTRALIWITALNTFLHNKFTGVGYFMFYKVSENYNILPHDIYDEFIWGLDAHSTFLNFLAETGILGFTMFVVYLCSSFYYSFKSIKLSLTNEQKQISIILNVLLFFIITTSIYSGAFTFGYNGFVLHIFIGLVIANYVVIKINSQREIEKTYQ